MPQKHMLQKEIAIYWKNYFTVNLMMRNSILLQLNVVVWYILLSFLFGDLIFIDQIYL